LWKKTAALPQWPRNNGLTYGDLVKMSGQFRDWYFNEGGLYLSKSARDAYGQAQGAITAVTDGRDSATRVNDADYEAIRIHCSNLRNELTEDLYTRRDVPGLMNLPATQTSDGRV
jgi:hypothetical protein